MPSARGEIGRLESSDGRWFGGGGLRGDIMMSPFIEDVTVTRRAMVSVEFQGKI
jgi:hypothetical protein